MDFSDPDSQYQHAKTTKPKVVLTGATGLLGRRIHNFLKERGWPTVALGYSRAEPPEYVRLDLLDKPEVEKTIEGIRPDIVIHCAAERSPDICESHPDQVKLLNVGVAMHLAEICSRINAFMFYVSSDYVFAGRKGEAPYEPDAKPEPTNFYGETKVGAEKAIREKNPLKGVILRVPLLYGESWQNSESAVNILLDAVWNKKKLDSIDMDHYAIRYPTNTDDVARVLVDLAEVYSKFSINELNDKPKILHYTAEEPLTKYEMCQIMGELAGLPVDHLNPVSDPPKDALVTRPYDCHLSNKELKSVGINTDHVPFRSWWQRHMRAFKH